jgi:hypothetical protein
LTVSNSVFVEAYKSSELSSSGVRISATYTVQEESCTKIAFRIENRVEDAVIKISSLKLEHGTRATDWCKADEDWVDGLLSASVDNNFSWDFNEKTGITMWNNA